jgi:hypothetical protein
LLLAGLPAFEHVRDIQLTLDAKKRTWLPPIFRHQAKERCMSAFRFNHSLWHFAQHSCALFEPHRPYLAWLERPSQHKPPDLDGDCGCCLGLVRFHLVPNVALPVPAVVAPVVRNNNNNNRSWGLGTCWRLFWRLGEPSRQRRIRRAGRFRHPDSGSPRWSGTLTSSQRRNEATAAIKSKPGLGHRHACFLGSLRVLLGNY